MISPIRTTNALAAGRRAQWLSKQRPGRNGRPLDGSTVQADEAYLRESIVDPEAKIVKGFSAGIMPSDFGQKLLDADIQIISRTSRRWSKAMAGSGTR